ncbi:Hypothetical predicted protein [Pelobates cultripes]|uniref:Uncharacterized protein n=1 Tax=Pelobates cultripes TaxID=61616 RepID=A0AAD1RHS8_PELCU|nr:Hypothetical predicted protein [Pelobates cultripes]
MFVTITLQMSCPYRVLLDDNLTIHGGFQSPPIGGGAGPPGRTDALYMGSGINLSKKAQKTAKKSAIPTTTNRERPQRTSDAGKKHTTSWTGNGGRDRPTRGRASGRDNATRRDATERRSPETFQRERRCTDGSLCTPGPGHGPAPPPRPVGVIPAAWR